MKYSNLHLIGSILQKKIEDLFILIAKLKTYQFISLFLFLLYF